MSQLVIEMDSDEGEALLLQLLPKLGGRVISKVNAVVDKPESVDIIESFVKFDGQHFYDDIELEEAKYEELKERYSNATNKNNSDVGKVATEIVAYYLERKIPNSKIRVGTKGADLVLVLGDKTEPLEVKGTTASSISWPKIKVSSQDCYNGLVAGMTMVRVVNADTRFLKLHFLKYGRDFKMAPEDRWSVHPIKGARTN